MALETVTHISDLVVTNPTSTDPKSEGDNHFRNIKTALKTDFPNISGVVTKTHTQLNNALDKTGDTMTGSLAFSGTALRLTGDFSNATLASRLAFQTSTVNSNTNFGVLPNGTAVQALIRAFNNSDPTNSASMAILVDGTQAQLISSTHGSGTALPMTFTVNGAERMRIDTSGNVLVTGSGGLGYSSGSGGTVTQATSKSTAVTLNKPSGQITMNGAALAANTTVSFTLNNTGITGDNSLVLAVNGGVASAGSYNVWAACTAGSATIYVRNISAGSLSEALILQFSLIKGATA